MQIRSAGSGKIRSPIPRLHSGDSSLGAVPICVQPEAPGAAMNVPAVVHASRARTVPPSAHRWACRRDSLNWPQEDGLEMAPPVWRRSVVVTV
jgi:hypothetical protein